ncbi:QSPP protein, partial [Stercorarius parasiticus]|nr:QSPP protein [Stercorarius parasiticus]
AVGWVFLVDTLNFSFWSQREEEKYLVKYKGKTYSGYWSLCAAVNRALDDGYKEFLPHIQSKSTLFQFEAVTPCPVITLPDKEPLPLSPAGPLQVLEGHYKVSLEPSLLQAEQPQLSQPVLIGEVLQPFDHLRGSPLDPFQQKKKVSFYKRAQILVADTWSVLEGKGDGFFDDISSLTIFADYRIPQVLVHLKAMKYSEELMKKLCEGLIFQSGDREEVEIRGCSIWCCALICKHLLELYEKKGQDMHEKINAVLLDYYLWDYARDHREEMKDVPFHRVRCIYY